MDNFNPVALPPHELVGLVWSRRSLWMSTTVACGVLAALVALVMPRYWEASQGLVVRQETAGTASSRPGKFADLYEMRTMQETILEIAKSQQVVVGAIQAVDRAMGEPDSEAPTLEDIEKFRKRMKMLPPDGGEFGKTEVFYFCMKDTSRERAMLLVGELCRQLEIALKQLRGQRAASLIAELEEEVKVTDQTLADETARLAAFETQVGADLGELRMLQSSNSGQSDLRMESVQLEADVRKFRTQVSEGQELIALLRSAESDPLQLIATPNSLLTTQPALRRLKDGLVDAQLATSRLSGTRSPDHPQVRAAVEAEQQIRSDLHNELVNAIRGAEVELDLSRDRLAATQERLDNLKQRFGRLAEMRAEYSNRVAALDNCRLSLDRARQNLSSAKAAEAAAHSGSLVTRLDVPETGPYPAGLGRTMVAGAGAMAGLLLGLGLVFLQAAPAGGAEPQAVTAPALMSAIKPSVAARTARAEVPAASSAPAGEWWDAPASVAATPTAVQIETPPSVEHATPVPASEAPVAVTAEVARAMTPTAPSPALVAETPAAAPREFSREAPRKRRESTPVVSTPAPAMAGSVPALSVSGGYGGMSLQEALRAAAAQMPN